MAQQPRFHKCQKLVFLMLEQLHYSLEKNMLHVIEKAIMVANIGFNPMNNGD
jgi:hypothetical protein